MLFLTVSDGPDGAPVLATADPSIIRAVATLVARRLTGGAVAARLHPLVGRRSGSVGVDGEEVPGSGKRGERGGDGDEAM